MIVEEEMVDIVAGCGYCECSSATRRVVVVGFVGFAGIVFSSDLVLMVLLSSLSAVTVWHDVMWLYDMGISKHVD